MSISKYNILFTIQINHDFFMSGSYNDAYILPTQGTQDILRKGKMIFRNTPTGGVVLFKGALSNSALPFIDMQPDVQLLFTLHVPNKNEFYNITDLTSTAGVTGDWESNSILFIQNDLNATNLNVSFEQPISSSEIQYSFNSNISPSDILIKVKATNKEIIYKDFTIENTAETNIVGERKFDYLLNLHSQTSGKYSTDIINNTDPSSPLSILPTHDFFHLRERVTNSMVGLIEIRYTGSTTLYQGNVMYQVNFKRNSFLWKYIVTNNKNSNLNLADITLSVPSTIPSPYPNSITFIKSIANNTAIFVSQTPIDIYQSPLTDLKLQGGSTVLIPNLPNPRRAGILKKDGTLSLSEIYVYI